jgi:flagellar biogenesis protein FliO
MMPFASAPIAPIACSPRRWCIAPALAALIGAAWAAPTRADIPVAPVPPEAAVADARVLPAALTDDAPRGARGSREGRLGPVPLPAASPENGGAASPSVRPATDNWKLLAAMGAAFAVLACYRAVSGRRTVALPPDVFEVLGEAAIGGQHSVRVVRFGPRTLLVGVSAAGCQTLAELTDPQATACIAAACRGVHPPIRPAVAPRSVAVQSPAVTAIRTGGEAA